MFKNGLRWFHSGGIFAALSETTGEVIIEGMKAAKAAGAICSFDLNFRETLWNIWGGQQKAVEIIARIVAYADVLVGNEEDLQKGLGVVGQDVEKKSKLDPSAFFGMIAQVTQKFPNVKMVATTLREVASTNHHTWGAVVWANGKNYVSPTCELDVLDRVGDGFASGLIYGLLSGVETIGRKRGLPNAPAAIGHVAKANGIRHLEAPSPRDARSLTRSFARSSPLWEHLTVLCPMMGPRPPLSNSR
jgi:2-dehydro-3-deoxygluconokinase